MYRQKHCTKYLSNKDFNHLCFQINQSNECTKLIIEAKQNYIAKMSSKLDCPDTASKTYWTTIKGFLNKKKDTKYTASPC